MEGKRVARGYYPKMGKKGEERKSGRAVRESASKFASSVHRCTVLDKIPYLNTFARYIVENKF